MPEITKVVQMYHEVQTLFAIIFGMCLQFVFGEQRTIKVGILIFSSALFVAMYLVPVFIEFLNSVANTNIKGDSKTAIAMYALSSLLSMEILAMTIKFLPATISIKVTKYLGVTDGKSK